MILNENNAKKILGHSGDIHSFMEVGGAKVAGNGTMNTASPEKGFYANKVMANGGTQISSGEHSVAPETLARMRYDTKEISSSRIDTINPDRAANMVKAAENEIAAKKMAQTKAATFSY